MSKLDPQHLVEEYFPRIHPAALALTGNPWDADDLAQETFLTASRIAEKFEGRSNVYTWLYGIMLNLERRERRRKGMNRNKLRVLWDNEGEQDKSTPAAETGIEVAEWKRSLWKFVAQLPDGQRQALVLRFAEQLSYEEIAETLECPLGTVKSRIFHGLATLRQMITADGGETREAPLHPYEDMNDAI